VSAYDEKFRQLQLSKCVLLASFQGGAFRVGKNLFDISVNPQTAAAMVRRKLARKQSDGSFKLTKTGQAFPVDPEAQEWALRRRGLDRIGL